MSKVKTLAAGTAYPIEIEKPISGWYFQFKVLKSDLGTGTDTAATIEANASTILDVLNEQIVSMTYKTKDGVPLFLFNNMGLGKLLEHAQSEEGIIKVSHSSSTEDLIEGFLPLNANAGFVSFNNDETLTLDITTSSKVISGQINTIESPIASPDWYKWGKLLIEQNATEKVFDVRPYESVMIPLALMSSTAILTITHTNGSVCRYTNEELKAIGFTTNDVAVQVHGRSVGGFVQHAILNVENAVRLEIHRSSTTSYDIYAVGTILVNNLQDVINTNQNFTSTTAVPLQIAAEKKL